MAAVSQTATTLTSTSNPHGNGYSWDIQAEHELDENTIHGRDEDVYPTGHPSLTSHEKPSSYSGNTTIDAVTRKHGYGEVRSDMRGRNAELGLLSAAHQKESNARSIHDDVSPSDSAAEIHEGSKEDGVKGTASDMNLDPELDDSKWIHRDKLAKIESEELQAAGIFLPRARDRARSKSANRPRRDQSQDKVNGYGRTGDHASVRSRKNSAVTIDPKTPDLTSVPSWDLRHPEEIAEESYFASNGSSKGISRIPVAKLSPAPIPSEHLERDTLLIRKRENSPADEDSITYPKPRTRSGSTGDPLSKASTNGTTPKGGQANGRRADSSPKKTTTTPGARKPSAPKAANGAAGRPKTRGGPSHGSSSTGGTTRPSTRSGELSPSSSKPMEGEPPWMVSAYRPDPRLPPDQQLLPTVAKRLQQEKWEREGKFGSIYDKEFRPLTDEGFLKPPEAGPQTGEADESRETAEDQADWPLKNEPKSPSALAGRTGSYSTMPKITEKPPMSPIPSPRTPSQPPQPLTTTRLPEPPEDPPEKKSGGCGCCIIM
ncbi:hypothetical protein V8F20_006675 [Naviculisporaceae sp. PSN 640]